LAPGRGWRWLALLSLVLLAGCHLTGQGSFLHPKGPVAAEDRDLFLITVVLMLIVVVPVFVLTPLLAWRYRLGNHKAVYRPRWDFSPLLEVLVWGLPVVIVIALGLITWQQTHRLDPYRSISSSSVPLQVQVIGLDWKWLFIYPHQDIASVNQLVIPAGRPVRMSLTSDTVMVSLLVPELAGQIYAMAGMRTELNMLADRPGHFLGENTQYNGRGFQNQKFPVVAMTPAGFDAWVAQVRTNGDVLDEARYAQLAKPSTVPTSETFKDVEPDLFYRVIGKYCPSCAAKLKRQDEGGDHRAEEKADHD